MGRGLLHSQHPPSVCAGVAPWLWGVLPWGGRGPVGFDCGRSVFWLQFGYQDGVHQLPGGSARQSPETSSLLGRVPAQALFGAGPVPSYGKQPGTDGGHLFQDLGMLSLPREKAGHPDPAGTRLQHSLRLPSDYRDTEEREQPVPLAAQPPPAPTGTMSPSQAPALIPILSPQPHSSWLRLSLLFGFMPVASKCPRPHLPRLLRPQPVVPVRMQGIRPDAASSCRRCPEETGLPAGQLRPGAAGAEPPAAKQPLHPSPAAPELW